jgi:2,3-bisphosphoglycerate-independent phosphoglycerate mutase
VKKVVNCALENDYTTLLIADHGNADFTINNDDTPNTAHSLNPVPCFAINTGYNKIKNGKLADIAPTILQIMKINIPDEMTGEILIK